MRIEKDFFTEEFAGCDVYEHRATVEGHVLTARFTVSKRDARYGHVPPLEFINRSLRRDLMAAIEKELYKGTR